MLSKIQTTPPITNRQLKGINADLKHAIIPCQTAVYICYHTIKVF